MAIGLFELLILAVVLFFAVGFAVLLALVIVRICSGRNRSPSDASQWASPPPARSSAGPGCLIAAMIGFGVVLMLVILGAFAAFFWVRVAEPVPIPPT